ncbi:hypothetical protein ABBQ38_002272 [Trebouxia sp. C0009 RCD-2024]
MGVHPSLPHLIAILSRQLNCKLGLLTNTCQQKLMLCLLTAAVQSMHMFGILCHWHKLGDFGAGSSKQAPRAIFTERLQPTSLSAVIPAQQRAVYWWYLHLAWLAV